MVSIREYEDTKCDIIYEYLPDDIDKLLKNNIISESFVKTGTMLSNNNDNNYDDIKFTEETIEDDQKSQNSDTWESDDENIVNTDHTIKKNNIKDLMNIDSESDNEQLDIDDI